MIIYHITPRVEWEKAVQAGQYTAPSLSQEGFIHASTGEQVTGTANLFYRGQNGLGQPGLVLLKIDAARLRPELRFDPVRTHGEEQHFPHIYGPLNLDAVIDVLDFPPNSDGTFLFQD